LVLTDTRSTPDQPGRRLGDYVGLVLPLVALLGIAAWSWGRLVEIQYDFGRELYVPWQLLNGRRLYVDLVYYYGPLSPYLNALAFRLFGAGIQNLMLCNLVITAIVILLFYVIALDVSDALCATWACLFFVVMFAFGNYFHPSICNFICPYSHTATHGLLLGLVNILLIGRANSSASNRDGFYCGLSIGLVFLTKPEMFVAAGVTNLVGLGLTVHQHRLTVWRALGLLSAWSVGAVVVITAAFILLCLQIPSQSAILGVLGSWPYTRNQAGAVFYRRVMGLDDPRGNLLAMLAVLPWYGMMLIPLALYIRSRWTRIILLAVGAGSSAGAVALGMPNIPKLLLIDALRPLPVLLAAMAIGLGWRLIRTPEAPKAQEMTRKLLLTMFAGLLLIRIFLKTSFINYGFVLAAPATLVLIIAWLAWLPAWIGARANRVVHTGFVLAITLLFAFVSLGACIAACKERFYTLDSGSDSFVVDPRCLFAVDALKEIHRRVHPGETLCVLPEGPMINYLARIASSVPYDCFTPPVLQMFGETQIIFELNAHPPDYILLVYRDTTEYGPRMFGRDYGLDLYSWVMNHYCAVAEYGGGPMREDGDGFVLMAPRPVQELESAQSLHKKAG
jgi:hypothetical protein